MVPRQNVHGQRVVIEAGLMKGIPPMYLMMKMMRL